MDYRVVGLLTCKSIHLSIVGPSICCSVGLSIYQCVDLVGQAGPGADKDYVSYIRAGQRLNQLHPRLAETTSVTSRAGRN